jgi:hypothetical protein
MSIHTKHSARDCEVCAAQQEADAVGAIPTAGHSSTGEQETGEGGQMKIPMKEGEKLRRNPNNPILSIVSSGRHPYIWIGNDADGDKFCFATLSGNQRLRALVNAILTALEARRGTSK